MKKPSVVVVYIDGVRRDDVVSVRFSTEPGRCIITGMTETISLDGWDMEMHHVSVITGGAA